MSKHLLASKHGDSEMFTSAFTSVHYVGYVTAMWDSAAQKVARPSVQVFIVDQLEAEILYTLQSDSGDYSMALESQIFQKILRSSLYLPKGLHLVEWYS